MKSILDKEFRYTPSHETDIRKTFARVRREQKQLREREAEASRKVTPIIGKQRT